MKVISYCLYEIAVIYEPIVSSNAVERLLELTNIRLGLDCDRPDIPTIIMIHYGQSVYLYKIFLISELRIVKYYHLSTTLENA